MSDEPEIIQPDFETPTVIPAAINTQTFGLQLIAAGLSSGVTFTETGVEIWPPVSIAKVRAVIAAHDPTPPPPVTRVAKIDMLRRMTPAEYTAMQGGLAQQNPLLQAIFNAAVTFSSDAPEWPLLHGMAVQLYGAARAAALLAPSSDAT